MPALQPPFRAEIVGSLLRPNVLKEAGKALDTGELTRVEFDSVLDAEIARVIARQEDIGLSVVTDGEFGRSSWFGFFFERMKGFRLAPSAFKFKDAEGHAFEWPTSVAEAPIRRVGPISIDEFERAKGHARSAVVKANLPTPSAFHFFRLRESIDPGAYRDMDAYFDDLVEVYRAEVADLCRAGCRYLQFDEVPVAMMCDPGVRRQAGEAGEDAERLLDRYIALMRRILADRPVGMTVGMHLCRGNFRGRWMAAGGYEPVADKLFNEMPVDAFFLEYDNERAGGFEPLRFVPKGRYVVLGLLSSKTAALEDEDMLMRRIDDAARHIALDQLALSTQCGFASVAGGNVLAESDQWAKLERIVGTAQRVWGSA